MKGKIITCCGDCTYYEIYNKAINDFKKEIIDMVNNSPVVENDSGEIRPMNIEEICEIITERLKNNNKQGG